MACVGVSTWRSGTSDWLSCTAFSLRERKTQPKNVTEAITKLLNSREKLLQHPLLSPTGTAAAAAPESKKGMTSSSSNRSKSGGAGKAKSSNKASAVFDHPGTLSRKS
eukprot:m.1155868 g.1155868  ORF g.1155868 m.1155868 type:complete len:108 (+) comp24491_c0_seq24:90-413(+)